MHFFWHSSTVLIQYR